MSPCVASLNLENQLLKYWYIYIFIYQWDDKVVRKVPHRTEKERSYFLFILLLYFRHIFLISLVYIIGFLSAFPSTFPSVCILAFLPYLSGCHRATMWCCYLLSGRGEAGDVDTEEFYINCRAVVRGRFYSRTNSSLKSSA